MNVADIVAAVFFGMALLSALLANVFMFNMIRAVNRKAADEHRIPYVAAMPTELVRAFREYRLLYPEGRLHIYAAAAMGSALLNVLMFVALLQAS
jgi:hypothetical protein